MENQTVPPEPIVLNQPNLPQKLTKPKSSSSKTLVVIARLVLILIVVGLIGFIFLGRAKPEETKSTEKQASSSANTDSKKTTDIGYVTALEGLNLREQPTTDSNIILLLPEGTQVQILGTDNDWYYVEAQTKGYVSKEYISTTKPEKPALLVFNASESPFNFLYHDVYKVVFKNTGANNFEYSFTSSDSYGGFSVTTGKGFSTLGNYALKNYSAAKKGACSVQFAASRKECEQLETDTGTLYLLLIETTLYKISYLKTEGGTLADINNIVFYTMFFKDQTQ